MATRKKLLLGALAGMLSFGAFAAGYPAYEKWLTKVGDFETLARSWCPDAMSGDAEKQERLAELYLGPQARQVKATPYKGIHFLFRAAVNGRPTAMRHLGRVLSDGAYGLTKSPAAARCWSRMPASFEARLACVELTDFRNPRARVPCAELTAMQGPDSLDGSAMAKLCLANKTPAILVPGLPPGPRELQRVTEYERAGIEWTITGDVYDEKFEAFRATFNDATVAALDAKHGRGYMERLAKQIESRLPRQ